jgi:hypothetical protein
VVSLLQIDVSFNRTLLTPKCAFYDVTLTGNVKPEYAGLMYSGASATVASIKKQRDKLIAVLQSKLDGAGCFDEHAMRTRRTPTVYGYIMDTNVASHTTHTPLIYVIIICVFLVSLCHH